MIKIQFTKMVGAGNDFIIIEGPIKGNAKKLAKSICDRHNGIGADGLLILGKSKKTDYNMRIINPDGSEAEMCGNGARCMAAYIVKFKKPKKKIFGMETKSGIILSEAKGEVAKIQLSNPKNYKGNIALTVNGQKRHAHHINTGVPHTIMFVTNLQNIDVNTIGRVIRTNKKFQPKGTNVNFVEQLKGNLVALRTYERGVENETLACGTGSVAAALIAFIESNPEAKDKKNASMKVLTASKEVLNVTFDFKNKSINNVFLKGSARFIAKGDYYA